MKIDKSVARLFKGDNTNFQHLEFKSGHQ
jgi:hypothetical protein